MTVRINVKDWPVGTYKIGDIIRHKKTGEVFHITVLEDSENVLAEPHREQG